MEILSRHGAQYRTKLLAEAHAQQFASCLRANALFSGVMVYESERAKHPERRFFVVYHPSDSDACAAILQRQQERRAAQARAEAGDYLIVPNVDRRFFWVQSASGEVYEVTDFSCSCPDYEFRCREASIRCKHQLVLSQEDGRAIA
jgi:hypothetical protein